MPTIVNTPNTRRACQMFAGGLWCIYPRLLPEMNAAATGTAAPDDKRTSPPRGAAGRPYAMSGATTLIEMRGTMVKTPGMWDALYGGVVGTVGLADQIAMAVADPGVSSIVLIVESGGGTVAGTGELAATVAAAARVKPVVGYIEDIGCSAAYWVASQCPTLIANAAAVVGSIGTYAVLADVSGALDAAGVALTVVSSGGTKGLGGDGAVNDDLIAQVRSEVVALNSLFIAGVAAGRRVSVDRVTGWASGATWIGAGAVTAGLVDRVGSLADAIAAADAASAGTAGGPGTLPIAGRPVVAYPVTTTAAAATAASRPSGAAVATGTTTAAKPKRADVNRYSGVAASIMQQQAAYMHGQPAALATAALAASSVATNNQQRSQPMIATTTTATNTALPEPMTLDSAKAAAAAEYDRNPTVGAAYVDRANYVATRSRELVDISGAAANAATPEPLTREKALAIAEAEFDRNPTLGAAYVDRANYAASRAHELLCGARPTVDTSAVVAPAVPDPLKGADPVAVGRWQRAWRFNTGNCRRAFATEVDYMRAMAKFEAARRR